MTDFSIVIPTIGRDTLPRTIESIRSNAQSGKSAEIIVVADTHGPLRSDVRSLAKRYGAAYHEVDAGFHDWGSPQLQHGYGVATGDFIQNMGDDDVMEPFAFETMKRAIDSLDAMVPLMFRTVLHPSPVRGNTVPVVLWHHPELVDKAITGQCFVIPNDEAKIGSWSILVDFGFITDTVRLWDGRVEWRTEVISQCY